jgi:hypothetical protein
MRLTLSPSWNTEGKGEEYELVVVGYEGGLALSAHNSEPLSYRLIWPSAHSSIEG